MKNKLIISAAALAVSSLFIVGFVFAWFRVGDNINELSFQIARINSEITLYKAEDCNFNGFPDLDINDDYIFNEIGYRYANTSEEETTEDLLKMQINNMMPTQIYTYKIAVNNKSEANNVIRFVFAEEESSNLEYLKILSVKIGETIDGITVFGNKFYFANNMNNNEFSEMTIMNNIEILGSAYATENDNQKEFLLQLEFETYQNLSEAVENENNKFSSQESYENAQDKSITLPLLRVYLEIL